MKKLIYALILCTGIIMCGCSSDSDESTSTGTLYGAVYDVTTGQPVANATIQLYQGCHVVYWVLQRMIATSATGSDGYFQINDITPGNPNNSNDGRVIVVSHPEYKRFQEEVFIRANHKTEMQILLYKN